MAPAFLFDGPPVPNQSPDVLAKPSSPVVMEPITLFVVLEMIWNSIPAPGDSIFEPSDSSALMNFEISISNETGVSAKSPSGSSVSVSLAPRSLAPTWYSCTVWSSR